MPPKKQTIKQKPWSKVHQKKYEWLYNYIKTIKPDAELNNYIDKYKRQLLSMIQNNKKWSDGSKEGLLFMIARYLYNKGDIHYNKTYSKEGFDLMQTNQEKNNENELDEKEKENYRDHEYFINIINSIDEQNINSFQQHLKYLLLNILTKQPPLRTSFYTSCKFIRAKKDNDHINNFILINRRGKLTCKIIINKDKASNYKQYAINKNLASIDIIDESLIKLINDSYVKYPRLYLFQVKADDNKPITQVTLLNWLREITNVSLINVDIMRSSYITWFYENNQTFGAREKLSKIMRHSVTTAQKHYQKVFNNDEILNTNTTSEDNKIIEELRQKIKDLELQLKKYTDVENINIKTLKKRRYDIIYTANNKKIAPKDETLKKYDIKYDDSKNLYYY